MLCAFFFFNDTATTEIYTLSLHDALPILLPHHAGRQGHAVPVPTRGGRRSHVAALRRRVAVVAPVPAPAGRAAAGEVRGMRVSRVVRRLPGARVRARRGRARRRSVVRVRADGRHGPHRAGPRGALRGRLSAGARLDPRGARAGDPHPLVRTRRGDSTRGGLVAPPGAPGLDAGAARRSAERDADRLLEAATVLRNG